MWSPDAHALTGEEERVRHYEASQFDKGARTFALACSALYAALSAGLVVAIVRAALGV